MNEENAAQALIRRNINGLTEALESGLLYSRLGEPETFMALTEAKRAWQALSPLVNQAIVQSRPREDKPEEKVDE